MHTKFGSPESNRSIRRPISLPISVPFPGGLISLPSSGPRAGRVPTSTLGTDSPSKSLITSKSPTLRTWKLD